MCLLQSSQVLNVLAWLTLHELVHLEMVHHPRLLPLAGCRDKKASICIQKASEASYKRRTNLVWSESCRTNDTNGFEAPAVGVCGAAYGMLDGQSAKRTETYQYNDRDRHLTSHRRSSRQPSHPEVSIACNDLPATASLLCCARVALPYQA